MCYVFKKRPSILTPHFHIIPVLPVADSAPGSRRAHVPRLSLKGKRASRDPQLGNHQKELGRKWVGNYPVAEAQEEAPQ